MTDKTGGPAFPLPPSEHMYADAGMTLRDYFAAKLMPSIIGTLNGPVFFEFAKGDFDLYAEQSYKMADAMLRAREK